MTCCQPVVVSPVKVAVASWVPVADHNVPVWVPVFFGPLKKRIPVTQPFWLARNFTPSSSADASSTVTLPGCCWSLQMVHGHVPGAGWVAPVVNVHVYAGLMACPW